MKKNNNSHCTFQPNSRREAKYSGKTKGSKPKANRTEGNEYFKGKQEPELSKYNDASWYAKNEQMLKDAASFSYNRPLGGRIPIDSIVAPTSDTVVSASATSFPGVMTLVTALVPGLSEDYNSPINLAAQNIFSFVRFNNSGSKNYEAADLMFYLQSMDSQYALWNFLKRAYGLAQTYKQKDWYMPRALFEGMNIDFDDIVENLSDFRLYLNTVASRLSSFCVPGNLPLFIRHSWLFSNIWKDSEREKAQLYQFTPAFFYQYDELSAGGGSLEPRLWGNWINNSTVYTNQFNPELLKFADIRRYVDEMLDAMTKSEDIGVMSGDILKAYGQDKLFKLSPIEEGYMVEPVYNEEVLNQIHNTTVLYETWRQNMFDDSWIVSQNVNSQTIIFSPSMPKQPTAKNATILNMPWEDVTPANTMVGSRLAVCYDLNETANTSRITACGTELVIHAFMCFNNYVPNSGKPWEREWYGIKSILRTKVESGHKDFGDIDPAANYTGTQVIAFVNHADDLNTAAMIQTIATLSLWSQFDWAPIVYNFMERHAFSDAGKDQITERRLLPIAGDMDNYTIIREDDLQQMHLTATMSLYNIPQIGSF